MLAFPGFNPDLYLVHQQSDPTKRDENYYLANVQAFYADYIRGVTTVGWDGVTRMAILRSFAEGRQRKIDSNQQENVVKQSAILDTNGNPIQYNSDAPPKPYYYDPQHEVWKILSPANKIMDAIVGKLMGIDYEISADPLDPSTNHEIEEAKLDRWVYAKNALKVQLAAKVAGVEYPEPDFLPEQPEDLDQYIEEFLPAHVRAVEKLVKHTFDISHWSPDLKMMFYRDLIMYHKAAIKNEYDPEDGKVKPVYVSPTSGDIQRSVYTDCRDSERAWHFYLMSITQLRQYFPDEDEDFFRNVAHAYVGQFGNPDLAFFDRYATQLLNGGWGYDPFKVCIGSFEWIDIDITKEMLTKKHNRETWKEVPLSKALPKDKVVRFTEDRMRFQAKWVVGTKKIFQWGPAYDVTEPTKGDTELTYRWIVLPGKSPIEQLLPIFENFQDLWEKFRELLRNSQGKIQFLDVDMLSSVDGKESDPQVAAKKAFKRFLATNKLLFRRVNALNLPNQNRPIEEMDGGMGSLFEQLQEAFRFNMQMVEYITGLNPLTLGATPDPNAPVTTTQMAMNATGNTLRPLVEGYMRVKQGIAENLIRWISVLIRGNSFSRKAYEMVIGKDDIQAIIAASKNEADYGIKLMPRPTELEKQFIIDSLKVATTPNGNGEREISTNDAFVIVSMLSGDVPVKTINSYFEKARRKQARESMARKKELMQQQAQVTQQEAAAATQNKAALDQQTMAGKMALQDKANQGNLQNTTIQESIRKDKEMSVQEMKNQGKAVEEALA